MVKQAIDLGVNFFDTANCYAMFSNRIISIPEK